jgi:DnaJ-class molecular chaperone
MNSKTKPTKTRKSLFDRLFGRSLKGAVCKRCHGHGYFRQGQTRIPCHACRGTGREPESSS